MQATRRFFGEGATPAERGLTVLTLLLMVGGLWLTYAEIAHGRWPDSPLTVRLPVYVGPGPWMVLFGVSVLLLSRNVRLAQRLTELRGEPAARARFDPAAFRLLGIIAGAMLIASGAGAMLFDLVGLLWPDLGLGSRAAAGSQVGMLALASGMLGMAVLENRRLRRLLAAAERERS